jgi:cytochrome o ubiquinol oxidase subunit II
MQEWPDPSTRAALPRLLGAVMTTWRAAAPRGLAACVVAILTSCHQAGVMDPQGPVAAAQWLLMINTTEIMLVVVVPVILLTLWVAWWYRASNERAGRSLNWRFEGSVEFVTWSIPALVVILLGGVTWISSHQLDPATPLPGDKKPVRIDVVSLDWKWLFIYPDQGVATLNQLVIPVATPVSFRLTSATVMNSFFVPQLGSQIYTMGGMTTRLHLQADNPGEFVGFSNNFNGAGFPDMRFMVKAVASGDFDGWVAQVRGAGRGLDDPAYAELTKPSSAVPPATFRSVDPNLFERIVQQTAQIPEKARAAGNAWCPPAARVGG